MPGLQAPAPGVFRRRRPETTALYGVVRDNLETLYGAIDDGALAVRIPKHARKELEGCSQGPLQLPSKFFPIEWTY